MARACPILELMKLRTSKRNIDRKELSPGLLYTGRSQQDRKAKLGTNASTKAEKKEKSCGDSSDHSLILTSLVSVQGSGTGGAHTISGITTRRSTIRSNVSRTNTAKAENLKEVVRVLRSRNLNCSLSAENKGKVKPKVNEGIDTARSIQIQQPQLSHRVTRSSSSVPTASSSVKNEAAIRANNSSKKVQIKTAILETNPLTSTKDSATTFGVKFSPRKRRRRRRKRSILSSVKTRRSSGNSTHPKNKSNSGSGSNNECLGVAGDIMLHDVIPEVVSAFSGSEVLEAPSKDYVSTTGDAVQNESPNHETVESDGSSHSVDSSESSSSSNSSNNGDTEVDGTNISQISFNESTSSSFLDDYTSQMDYCSEEDLSLFRDEYCPNGISSCGPSNPFGLSSVTSSSTSTTNNVPGLLPTSACGTTDSAAASPSSTTELYSCTFPSSTSWFQSSSQASSTQLNNLASFDNSSTIFYQDSSNGANNVPSSSLCKTGNSSGSTTTAEYNSIMPCSSTSAVASPPPSSATWAGGTPGSSAWGNSTTSCSSQDNLTDEESRSSWSQILEMSTCGEEDNNEKDSSSTSAEYNDHNMHFGVPSTASAQGMMQTQHDYSHQLMYSHGCAATATMGYNQESTDNSLITSCTSVVNNAMAMPSPNYTYYTSKLKKSSVFYVTEHVILFYFKRLFSLILISFFLQTKMVKYTMMNVGKALILMLSSKIFHHLLLT